MKTKQEALARLTEIENETKALRQIIEAEDKKCITDRIKTFKDACKEVGENYDALMKSFKNEDDNDVAFKKLKIIIRALNEGWKPNWSNNNEWKYIPYFNMGCGFSFYSVRNRIALSAAASSLYFKSENLAKYAANQFISEYKQLLS